MTDDTRTYGDAFEAVNAYVQRLGHLDGYAGVCLIAVLKNLLFDAGWTRRCCLRETLSGAATGPSLPGLHMPT